MCRFYDTFSNYFICVIKCSCTFQEKRLQENRVEREKLWGRFVDDMRHKQNCVENTFEEKEEELREFYSDLERKLHIHK